MLAFTPLIADNSLFYSSSTTESIFLRGLLFLLSILFVFNFFYTKKFRDNIVEKTKIAVKNPLFISISVFVFMFIISTIFAIDKYSAFWGTIERAEGLTGIIYFFSFFIFSLLIFERKDWLWFFKLSLLTTLALIFKEFVQFLGGMNRPDSFLGNPTFLAGYLLFPIFCSLIVFSEVKNNFWKYLSIGIFLLSILGVFITETRGTIVGFILGIISVLIYGVLKGKDVFYKRLNLHKLSIIILCLIIVFSAVFILTRKSEIWQKVPGLGRITVISNEDSSTQTRLIMTKLSIDAVNPMQNGLKKTLIGWGPENFDLAYAKYFNPEQFKYEIGWFDRAHNKIFDVLVMNGILGLMAYLTVWFLLFSFVLKKKGFSLTNTGLLLFGVSLFVHLLFVFDQITTYLYFFAILSFILSSMLSDNPEKGDKEYKNKYDINKRKSVFIGIFFSFLALFLSFIFFKNDLPAYIQLKSYASLREKSEVKTMLSKINSVFEPLTTAQAKIRYDFLSFVSKNYNAKSESIVKLSDISFLKAEEYAGKRPFDLQFLNLLGLTYTTQGKNLNNSELLKKGEEYFKKILLFSPNKLDFNYGLALNWLYQKKFNDSFNLFEKIFNTAPEYFSQKDAGPEGAYILFLQHFYEIKDENNFIKTAKRLKENNYSDSSVLDQIINLIQKNNFWPYVNFIQQ